MPPAEPGPRRGYGGWPRPLRPHRPRPPLRLPRAAGVALALAAAAGWGAARPARGDTIAGPGTRVLGLGGGLRGAATGSAALAQNPSGMALVRSYIVEGSYQHARPGSLHAASASVVDSTSGFNLAGGLGYDYLKTSPGGGPAETGHEVAFALAFPLGQRIFIGAAGKYLRLRTETPGMPADARDGLTFSLGATLRPFSILSIGVAAENLRDLGHPRVARQIAGGVALTPVPQLLVAADAVVALGGSGRDAEPRFTAGVEYVFADKLAVRAGGGWRNDTRNATAGGGLSFLAEVGAFDLGFAQDVSGSVRATVFAASLRLFVPSP